MAYQGNHPLSEAVKHNPHVQSLLHKHAEAEEALRGLLANPAVSDEEIKEAKLKKLHLTEQIVSYQSA